MSASPVATAQTHPHLGSGANRVLWMSTLAFTLMFAVWLMFGVLGVPIQKEFGLTDVELSWISAVAVLNGSMWRLPAGMLTDRIGGRKVTIALLVLTAIPCYFLTQVGSYGSLLILAFLVGFAGNLFSVGIAWNSAWTPRERQGYALGVFGAGNVGASVTKLLVVLFPPRCVCRELGYWSRPTVGVNVVEAHIVCTSGVTSKGKSVVANLDVGGSGHHRVGR